MKKHKYEDPTPIQAQSLPTIMSGRDIIGIARTGSGKTLAFILPMLRHVLDQPPLEMFDGPIALLLTPTRELAIQTHNEIKKFSKSLKLSSTCVYGGAGIKEQIADLKRGSEIVVCTPGTAYTYLYLSLINDAIHCVFNTKSQLFIRIMNVS